MPELRKDPIVDRWVIIASDRARRPQDYTFDREPPRTGVCPFCPGQEGKTPSELLAHLHQQHTEHVQSLAIHLAPSPID